MTEARRRLLEEVHPAWHDLLASLAGVPWERSLSERMALVSGWEEVLLAAVIERRQGTRPRILESDPALVREEVSAYVLPERAGQPRELAWATLCDGHRDLVSCLCAEEVLDEPEMLALAAEHTHREYARVAHDVRTWRGAEERGLIFHLAPMEAWVGRPDAEYRPASLDQEGFVHCTRQPGLLEQVAARVFADRREPLAMLVLDVARIGPELRWEGGAIRFPHVYGPVNLDAVLDVRRMDRDPAGRWTFPWA